jgi:hypothetical protein
MGPLREPEFYDAGVDKPKMYVLDYPCSKTSFLERFSYCNLQVVGDTSEFPFYASWVPALPHKRLYIPVLDRLRPSDI